MFFGKKLSLKFIDPRKIDVDCINNIKSAITKRRQAGYGDVCEYSGGNEPITNIKSIQNIDKQFLFTLTSDSHDNLNKLYDEIEKEFDEMDFKYLIEEQMQTKVLQKLELQYLNVKNRKYILHPQTSHLNAQWKMLILS